MQLLNGANKSHRTRVCWKMRPRRKPNVYHRSGGDSQIPTVAKAVRMGHALPNPIPKLRKDLLVIPSREYRWYFTESPLQNLQKRVKTTSNIFLVFLKPSSHQVSWVIKAVGVVRLTNKDTNESCVHTGSLEFLTQLINPRSSVVEQNQPSVQKYKTAGIFGSLVSLTGSQLLKSLKRGSSGSLRYNFRHRRLGQLRRLSRHK